MEKIIETSCGKMKGEKVGETLVFKSVPYAKPPVGDLRWKEPVPFGKWDGVLDATKFPNRCWQYEISKKGGYGKEFYSNDAYLPPLSEDCLYLNIWAPEHQKGEKLPVAMWIHGGGLMGGASSDIVFDGAEYARRDVILVTINYRLGVFGFLAHPELYAQGIHGGNLGFLDQICALDWIRENIGAFGGDKDNITVFGQSGGAISTQALVSSPLARGKFARVIFQSGGGYGIGFAQPKSMENAQGIAKKFEKLSKMTLEQLKDCPADKLVKLTIKVIQNLLISSLGRDLLPFAPVIDGYFLTGTFEEISDRGEAMHIPYMTGCTRNDFGVKKAAVKDRDLNMILRASKKWCQMIKEQSGIDCYTYYFTRELLGDKQGAFHSSEQWYMFGTLGRSWRPKTDADYALSAKMLDCWTNFIKTGNPNTRGGNDWRPCTTGEEFVMEFDV